jgi:hypothetical protein
MMRSGLSHLSRAAAVFAALTVCHPALAQGTRPTAGQQQAAPPPIQIDRNGVLILIRSTLLALDHANRTGNYTVLRDLGAPGFQASNSAARLGEIFANLRSQNLDLSGLAVLEPQLTILPTSVSGGMMRMAGFFPSVPTQINFDLLFAPVEGRWRLFGISLNLGQSGPVAPATEPPPDKPPEQTNATKPQARPETKPEARPAASSRPAPARRTPPQQPAPSQPPASEPAPQ